MRKPYRGGNYSNCLSIGHGPSSPSSAFICTGITGAGGLTNRINIRTSWQKDYQSAIRWTPNG